MLREIYTIFSSANLLGILLSRFRAISLIDAMVVTIFACG